MEGILSVTLVAPGDIAPMVVSTGKYGWQVKDCRNLTAKTPLKIGLNAP